MADKTKEVGGDAVVTVSVKAGRRGAGGGRDGGDGLRWGPFAAPQDELNSQSCVVRVLDMSSVTGSAYDSFNVDQTDPTLPVQRYFGVRDTGGHTARNDTSPTSPGNTGPHDLETLELPFQSTASSPWLDVTDLGDSSQVGLVHQQLLVHYIGGISPPNPERPPDFAENLGLWFHDKQPMEFFADTADFGPGIGTKYRTFPTRWQLPFSSSDAYGVSVNSKPVGSSSRAWQREPVGSGLQAAEVVGGYAPTFWPGGRFKTRAFPGPVKVAASDPWFEPFDLSDTTNFKVTTAALGTEPHYSDPEVAARPTLTRGGYVFLVPQWWRLSVTWQGVYLGRCVATLTQLDVNDPMYGPLDPTFSTPDATVKYDLVLRDFSVTAWKKALVRPVWPIDLDIDRADVGSVVEISATPCAGHTLRWGLAPHGVSAVPGGGVGGGGLTDQPTIDDPRSIQSTGPFPLLPSDPDTVNALCTWADASKAFQAQLAAIPNLHNSGILGDSVRLKRCSDSSHVTETEVIDYKFGVNGHLTVTQDNTPAGHMVGALLVGSTAYYVWRATPTTGRATLVYDGPFNSRSAIPSPGDTRFRLVQDDAASFSSLDPTGLANHLLNPF